MVVPSSGSRMDPERERALVARSRSDASAFAELYDWYLPRIHGFVARRTGDHATAEDVTAMTFERALGAVRSDRFRNEAFGPWLYRVAANALVDHVRRSRRTVPLLADAPGEDAAPGDERALAAFAAAVDRDAVRLALAELADGHRRVLVLRFLDDLDPDEAAAVLGCSRGTFAVRLHRALRALRCALEKGATDAA